MGVRIARDLYEHYCCTLISFSQSVYT